MIRRFITLLMVIGIFMVALGCQPIDTGNDFNQYRGQPDLHTYYANSKTISSVDQFEAQLKEYYDFSKDFFSIWYYHTEETELLLHKFNNPSISIEDKIVYSGELRKKYENFYQDIIKTSPPPEALKAYKYALNAISQRILFFEEFEKSAEINVLIEIEKESYLSEKLFWEEIDKIYSYFDQTAEQLGISTNNQKIERL